MARITDKMKTDQKNRLNAVTMRVRHVLTEAVDNDEITKIEAVMILECVKAESLKTVFVKTKLPAPTDEEIESGVRNYQKTNNDNNSDNFITT